MSIKAKVKWFNAEKGYGFVSPEDGSPEAFLHMKVLDSVGLRTIKQGATIACEIVKGDKGRQVASIQHVDESGAVPAAPLVTPAAGESVVTGKVKYFALHQGYGFAIPDGGGQDVFIGAGALGKSNLSRVKEGQRVRMLVSPGKKGPQASRVDILGD